MLAMKPSRSEFVDIQGLRIHVRRWGTPGAPRIFLLHGWMDCSATFQFLVDALAGEWDILAPDWRGFGLSDWQHANYLFPQYAVDLEILLDHYSPRTPAILIGHSMGGNIATLFAALRPQRVARLVSLDAYGMPLDASRDYPARLSDWLRDIRRGPLPLPAHADIAGFAAHLMKINRRLPADRARFLATHFSRRDDQGRIVPAADPWQTMATPLVLYEEDYDSFWRLVQAPVLWVTAEDSFLLKRFAHRPEDYRRRVACFRHRQEVSVADASHNLHHDQPERLAPLIESFIAG